jgi:hypothetical protein
MLQFTENRQRDSGLSLKALDRTVGLSLSTNPRAILRAVGPQGEQGIAGVVQSIVAGTNTTVDNTDPANPIIAADTPAVADVTGLVAELALKAPLASPTFTGNPLAPTPSPGDADTSIATTAFVAAALAAAAADIVAVRVQRFTSDGTYTPHASMLYCIIECVGGGGSGAGGTGPATGFFVGGGGGSGGYSRGVHSASDISPSKAVAIGAGGTAPAAGNNNGGAGGDTSVGVLVIGKGGAGGMYVATAQIGAGGAGGVAGTGNMENPAGNVGRSGCHVQAASILMLSGEGASSRLGPGAAASAQSGGGTTATGTAATANSGGGGSGGNANATTGTFAGGNGGTGLVVITEFCSS